MPSDTPRSKRSRTARVSGALALCLAVVAGACGDSADGRSLRTPAPDQTTTTGPATAGVEAGSAGNGSSAGADAAIVQPLILSSSAVTDGGELPARYTCRGEDVSPPLLWTGVPAGTAELAIVARDVDAEGFVHWVVAGMPANLGGIAEATAPTGAVEAANDFGRPGWAGPCPPSGTHHYEIRVYALAQPSGVVAGEPGADAAGKVEAAPALASAILGASSTAG